MSNTPSTLVSEDTVIRVTIEGLKAAPRYMYIVRTLEKARELFKNAYIIPFVKWYKIPTLFFTLTGKDPKNFENISYRDITVLREQVYDFQETLRESLGTCYTVIPFTPTKVVNAKVTDWKVDKNTLENTSELFNSYGRWRHEQREFMKVLLENANAMSVLLRGSYYSNPCEFCALVFNRLTGECEIFSNQNQHKQTCQPKITFGAQIFANDTADIGHQIDYARAAVNEVWEELNAPMEV